MLKERLLNDIMEAIFNTERTKIEKNDRFKFIYVFIQTIQPKDKPAYKQAVFVNEDREVWFSSSFRIVEQAEHLISMNDGGGLFGEHMSVFVKEIPWYGDKTTLSLQF